MRVFHWVLILVASLMLAACGGGDSVPYCGPGNAGCSSDGGGEGDGSTSGTPTLILSISSTTVTSAAPATITATAKDAKGVALAGQVVSFSTNGGLGVFDANSALTDDKGVATVKLSPAGPNANGADLVVAKVTGTGSETSGTIGFQVAAASVPPVGSPTLAIALSDTKVTAAAPVVVTSTLKDAAGNPLSKAVVKFSSIDGLGAFNPSSALTDANGVASVKLSPATSTTNGADLAVATTTVAGSLITATAGFTASSAGAPATGSASIALTLSSSTVTTLSPATAAAVVKDTTGAGVPGLVVKFNTVDGLGVFAVRSALTDASGKASVVLSAAGAGQSGADQVIASTTFNGAALQASQGFQLIATSATISGFSADVGGTLGAYGQTNLTVSVAGAPLGAPVNLAVNSDCVAKGKATVTPASTFTTTGTATFTYRDAGCGAVLSNDSLQASIVGTSATRALKINLTKPDVSGITFTSASPQTIYLKGSGLTETSTVTFTVVDTAGNGLPNQSVTLTPTTLSGGLTIDGGSAPVTKLSDSLGHVSVLINSGTVPTPVGVRATLGSATTVSSALSIAVGLPSQLNFSLSQGTRNIEGYDVDGTTNTYSIIASDRLANPVPVGTSINFIAEGGQIEPIKTTELVDGIARTKANFVSASPRPLDGRVTVLAYTLGEESFLDTDGNNIWKSPPDSAFQDLGSVFMSRNFLQKYFSATDQLIPLSIPGGTSTEPCVPVASPLLALNATIPTVGGSTCDGKWGRAYVRRATETVLSTSVARPVWLGVPAGLSSDSGGACARAQDVTTDPGNPQNLITGYSESTGAAQRNSGPLYLLGGPTTLYLKSKTSVFSFMVADNNPVRLNPVAAGSSISASGTEGLTVTVLGGSPVPSTSNATFASVSVTFSGSETAGTVTINVTSPGGVTTTTFQSVKLVAPDADVPSPCH